MVAEKTMNCKSLGRLPAILSTVSKNPISKVMSASSTTKILVLLSNFQPQALLLLKQTIRDSSLV